VGCRLARQDRNCITIENSNASESTELQVSTSYDSAIEVDGEVALEPQLSVLRVAVAILITVAALFVGGVWVARHVWATQRTLTRSTWFAPYVDATLSPTFPFQDPSFDQARQSVLGFIVSSPTSACSPSWGGAYSLAQADAQLNMGNRIAQYQSIGGNAVVSFGGAANSELALSCTKVSSLANAYESVIHRYHLSIIDLDIEGSALQDWPSIKRRALAIYQVESSVRSQGGHLAVWVTLPVASNGLQGNAISVVDAFLADHVTLAGVNVMAMNFENASNTMLTNIENSLTFTHAQLSTVFASHGISLNSSQVWNDMGATVEIGQNGTAGEVFSVSDARALTSYASTHHLGRISMWSLNRDAQCGTAFPVTGVQSNTCSGVAQSNREFTKVFLKLSGGPSSSAPPVLVTTSTVTDNPATSPYPIWQPNYPYVKGYKVVREGHIYQAKWYNTGEDPAAQVQYQWQTPWLLIGPVLAGDTAPTTTTLAPGTDPAWSSTAHYQIGDRVLFDGLPYQAKWYNTGNSPAAEPSDPTGSPWAPLFTIPGEPPTATN
jgi:chitinase